MSALLSQGAVIALLVLGACRGPQGTRGGSDDAAFADLPAWHLVLPAELSIGSATGDGPDALSGRVSATRFSDGLLVIADRQTMELKYFDATGQFMRTVGRPGGGPGEFRGLAWVGTCQRDSLYAYDRGPNRMSVFDRDGKLSRSFTLHSPNPSAPPAKFACDPSGRFVVAGWMAPHPDQPVGGYDGAVPLALVGDSGKVIRTLQDFPGVQRYRSATSDLPRVGGRELVFGVGNGRVYGGTGAEFAVSIVDFNGRTVGQLSQPWTSEPVTADAWNAFLEAIVPAEAPDQARREMLQNFKSAFVPPDAFAPYDTLLVDAIGDVWIRALRTHRVPHTWVVFAPDGPAIARLTMPVPEAGTEVRLLQVDTSRALVRAVDSLGVNSMRVYRVDRGQQGGAR